MAATWDWLIIAGWVGALGAAGAIVGRLMLGAGVPGGRPSSALLGGLLAGTLLGATVLGRIAPQWHQRAFVGGVEEQAAIDAMERRNAAEIAALLRIDATPIAVEEQRIAQQRELAPLLTERDAAQSRHRERWMTLVSVLGAAWLILGATGAAARARARESLLPGVVAGLGAALFAGAPAFLLIRWMTQASVETAALFACAVAVGGAHFDARTRRSGTAGRRIGVDAASLTALLLGTVVAAVLSPNSPLLWLAVSAAAALVMRALGRLRSRFRRALRGCATELLLPALVAIAGAQVDFIAAGASGLFWVALIISAIFCADGRWLGGWVGWWAMGRDHQWRGAWTRSSAAMTAGVGGMQIALALGALLAGVIPPAMAAALLLSAPMLELATPMRRRIALGLDSGAIFEPPPPAE